MAQLALYCRDVARIVDDMPSHGVFGCMGALAGDSRHGTDLVPYGPAGATAQKPTVMILTNSPPGYLTARVHYKAIFGKKAGLVARLFCCCSIDAELEVGQYYVNYLTQRPANRCFL